MSWVVNVVVNTSSLSGPVNWTGWGRYWTNQTRIFGTSVSSRASAGSHPEWQVNSLPATWSGIVRMLHWLQMLVSDEAVLVIVMDATCVWVCVCRFNGQHVITRTDSVHVDRISLRLSEISVRTWVSSLSLSWFSTLLHVIRDSETNSQTRPSVFLSFNQTQLASSVVCVSNNNPLHSLP